MSHPLSPSLPMQLLVALLILAGVGAVNAQSSSASATTSGGHASHRCISRHRARSHATHCRKKHKASEPPKDAGKPVAEGKRTLHAGAVELTPAERSDLQGLNSRRAQAGVAPLSTSPELQAISERRTHEMAEHDADYAGHDVAVDIKDGGYCTEGEREISGFGDELYELGSGPGEGNGEQFEVLYYEIETNPKFKLVGDAILETSNGTFAVEDYAAPC